MLHWLPGAPPLVLNVRLPSAAPHVMLLQDPLAEAEQLPPPLSSSVTENPAIAPTQSGCSAHVEVPHTIGS
jgi:hypothetical protein